MRTFVLGIILISIFFFRQIFAGEVWYCCDNLLINIPARLFQKEAGFALINPYIFSGARFIADINLAVFYPGNILFWIFDNAFRALTISIIVHFWIAFVGMYLLTRSEVSASVFTFSGTFVTFANNLPMLQVASFVPWVFLAWKKNLFLFVLLASVQIFAGHAQFMYFTWLLLVAWTIWFRPKNIWTRFAAVVVVTLITSVQTIPFLEFARGSTRATFGYDYAVFDSLNPLAIARLLIPWSVGILNQGTARAMGGSVYGYVGVLPLILALVASRRKPEVRFFLVVAIVSFIAALGKYTPIYWLFYKFLPGVASFRSPQHFLLIWTFAIAILAGYGSQKLTRSRWLLVTAATAMVIVAFAALGVGANLVILNSAVSAIFVSLFYKFRTRLVLCTLVFVDLFLFTRSNIITLPLATVSSWFEKSDALVKRLPSDTRIYVHKDLYKAPIHKRFGKFDWPEEAAWQVAILRPNINMLYHIPSIDGYASIVSQDYQDSFALPATDPTGVNLGQISGRELVERGVNTVLAPPDPKYIGQLYPLQLSEWQPNLVIYRDARK